MTGGKTKNTIDTDSKATDKREFHLYTLRWFMLCIFISFTFMNSVQWGEYIIISNLVQNYYRVESKSVDWTQVVYMALYIPLIFPALWLLDRKGIRYCLTLSCFGLALGAWIKVYASMARDRFPFVLAGQTIEAGFQVLAFGFAARVAALWFGSHEVSLACALAIFGDQMGTAFGFLLPNKIVTGGTTETIGAGLLLLNLIIAGISTAIFLAALLFFRERPKTPPSAAQMLQTKADDGGVMMRISTAIRSKGCILMIVSYGMNISTFNTYVTLFNDIFLKQFKNEDQHIGFLGFLIMISGVVGSIIFGYTLDRTHTYKGTTLVMYCCSFVAALINVFALKSQNLILVYVSNAFVGFSQIGYYSIAVQLCIEITFPLSEGFTSSLLLLASHVIGVLVSRVSRFVFDTFEDFSYACFGLAGMLFLGIVLTMMIPSEMKRYKIERARAPRIDRNDDCA